MDLEPTPAQPAGPFYPGENAFHADTDLTRIPGHARAALGQVIYVRGRVLNERGEAVLGARIEIWQACASGKYNDPKDPNPAPLDPDFKYWAETYTDDNGCYGFKTIVPGAYPDDESWTRPPHIHFKISRAGYRELFTQMYFRGEELNDRDLILLKVPARERARVIVDFQPSPEIEPGARLGHLDISLRSAR